MKQINDLLGINKKIVLASKSPRRKLLLENLGFVFDVVPSSFDEDNIEESNNYKEYVQKLAYEKGNDVAHKVDNAIIISSDTIVVLKDEILHKPTDKKDAFRILKTLSNNTHTVYTGVSIIDSLNKETVIDFMSTNVSFRKLSDEEIHAYIETGSPMDKAGAYGIQDDFGAVFVKHIEGCYYNIVGLPLELLYRMLKEISEVSND